MLNFWECVGIAYCNVACNDIKRLSFGQGKLMESQVKVREFYFDKAVGTLNALCSGTTDLFLQLPVLQSLL